MSRFNVHGHSSCPCANMTSVLLSTTVVSLSGFVPPVGYGSGECRTWDSFRQECLARSPPSWCTQTWCYVGLTSCFHSRIYYRRSLDFPLVNGLYYSYSTCSSSQPSSAYLDYRASTALAGQDVRVSVPYSWPPYYYKRDPTTGLAYTGAGDIYENASIPWEGAFISFLRAVVNNTPWGNVSIVTVSGAALALYPGMRWTAAVQDVNSELADFAVADFWVTVDRAELSSFTSPAVYRDQMYLWVPRPTYEPQSVWKDSVQLLKPFRADLWCLVVVVVMMTSVLETWLQRAAWVHELPPRTNRLQRTLVLFGKVWPPRLARSTMHLLMGSVPEQGEADGQTTAYIGWAIFILVTVSSYTANLAAFLVTTTSTPRLAIGSMSEAISGQFRVCLAPGLLSQFRISFPGASFHAMEDLSVYREEHCDCVVWTLYNVQHVEAAAASMCELNLFAAQFITDIAVAFPATAEFEGPLSYWMQHLEVVEKTPLSSFYSQTFEGCPASSLRWTDTGGGGQSQALEPFTVLDLSFPVFVWGGFCILAVVYSSCSPHSEPVRVDVATVSGVATEFGKEEEEDVQSAAPGPSTDAMLQELLAKVDAIAGAQTQAALTAMSLNYVQSTSEEPRPSAMQFARSLSQPSSSLQRTRTRVRVL